MHVAPRICTPTWCGRGLSSLGAALPIRRLRLKASALKAEMLDLLRQIAADLRWIRARADRQEYKRARANDELEERKEHARNLAQESLGRSTE